jgi:hypothetical protein
MLSRQSSSPNPTQTRQTKESKSMAREAVRTGISKSYSPPTHDEIARRAYQIFVERGRPEGRDMEHWLEAEAQLVAAREPEVTTIPIAKASRRTTPQVQIGRSP